MEAPQENQELAGTIQQSIYAASAKSPVQAAEVHNVAKKLELTPEIVESDIVEARRLANTRDVDYGSLIANNPHTANFLKYANRADLVSDSIDTMTGIEGWLHAVGKTYRDTDEANKAYKEYAKAFDKGLENDPALVDRLGVATLKASMKKDMGGIGDLVIASAEILPSTVDTAIEGAKGGAVGAVAGFGLGGTAGAAVGARIGSLAGAAKASYDVNYGSMLYEMSQLKDEKGNQLDRNVIKGVSQISAGLISGLDIYGLDKWASTFPSGKQIVAKLAGKDAIKKAIENPTTRKALQKFFGQWGTAVGSEASTEAAQELIQILGVNQGIDINNQKFKTQLENISFADGAQRVGDTFAQTAKGMILTGAAGPTVGLAVDNSVVRASKDQRKKVQEIVEFAKADKVLARTPDVAEEFVQEASANGGIENAYIDAKRFSQVMTDAGLNPVDVADQLGVATQLDEATSLGAPLVVPIGKFYQVLAPSVHMEALKDDIHFSADGLSVRQLGDLNEVQKQEAADVMLTAETTAPEVAKEEKELNEVVRDFQRQAIVAEKKGAVSRAATTAFKSFVKTMSKRTGVSPKQFWEQNKIAIQRGVAPLMLGEKQFEQATPADINSAEFKNWFNGSKVVDDSGNPLVVYHGTPNSFTSFEKKKSERTFGGIPISATAHAFFFTSDRNTARNWGLNRSSDGMTSNVMPVYLSMKNPIELSSIANEETNTGKFLLQTLRNNDLSEWSVQKWEENGIDITELDVSNTDLLPLLLDNEDFVSALKKYGFDGAFVDEGSNKKFGGKSYAVFEPTQIKSVDNKGSFDPANPNIYKQQAVPADTNSAEFKNWFGDSKVVDKSGKPMVVYHGTPNTFESFDVSKAGSVQYSDWGAGIYLTPSKFSADYYRKESLKKSDTELTAAFKKYEELTRNVKSVNGVPQYSNEAKVALSDFQKIAREKSNISGGNVMELYVSIKNPYIQKYTPTPNKSLSEEAKSKGHDGIFVLDANGDIDEIVAFSATQIKSVDNKGTFDPANPNIYKQQAKGSIEIQGSDQYLISLFTDADESTLLHEMGHYFHFVFSKYAQSENAPADLKADYAKTLEWLGAKSGEDITREQAEKFARGWEVYLFEGKAPSKAVASIFKLFKNWLTRVYQSVANIQYKDAQGNMVSPKISPEIRGVFDRLLATEEEIDSFSQMKSNQPLFKDAKSAGMTAAQYEDYLRLNKTTIDDAKAEIVAKAMSKVAAERRATYREKKAEIRKQVEAEADRMPVYIAEEYIKTGVLKFVTAKGAVVVIDEVDPSKVMTKLNRDVVEKYIEKSTKEFEQVVKGEKVTTTNRRLTISTALLHKDGVHPVKVAELVGMPSGSNLMEWLGTYPSKEQFIKQESAIRLANAFDSELLTDENIRESAIEAIDNESRFEALALELRSLEKLSKRKAVSVAELKKRAEAYVRRQTVKGLSYKKHETAAVRAGNRAASLVAKGKFADALEAKRQQLANIYIYKEIQRVQDEIQSAVKKITSTGKGSRMVTLIKASSEGQGYADAVKSILQKYQFVTDDNTEYRPIAEFVKARSETDPIVIDDAIVTQQSPISYKELTVRDLFAVRDAVENIYTVAKISLDFMQGIEVVSQAEVAEAMLASLQQLFPDKFKAYKDLDAASPEKRGAFDTARDFFDGSMRINEFIFMELDGNRKDFTVGPVYKYIFNTIKKAKDKYLDASIKASKDLKKLFSVYTEAELAEEVEIEGLGTRTKLSALTLLLNAGNEENYTAVIEGFAGKFENEFGKAQYEKFLNSLSKKDFDFAQSVWDYLETYWPEVKQANIKRTGVDLEKVQARALETQHGVYRGGYYPIKFDRNLDVQTRQRSDAQDLKDFNNKGMFAPMTRHSHRKERVGSAGKPVTLDIGVLFGHVDDVIKDLTMYDAVRAVDRLLGRQDVTDALVRIKGADFVQDTRDWLNSSINDQKITPGIDQWMAKLRANASIVQMGYAISTAVSQVMGLATTADEVGVAYTAKATSWLYSGDGAKRRAFIEASSATIRHRFETFNRDARDALREVKGEDMLSKAKRSFFIMTQVMDREVSSITWLAGYLKATEEMKMEHDAAVDYADGVVRITQGSGLAENMSKLLRSNNKWQRLFTMFQSFFNVLYNRFYRLGQRTIAGQVSPVEVMQSLALLWWIPAAAGELIVGRGPKEDEEFWKWLARIQLTYPLAVVPVIGPLARTSIESAFGNNFGFAMTPLEDVNDRLQRITSAIKKSGERTPEENFGAIWKNTLYLAGYAVGLPSRQISITAEAATKAVKGEEVSPPEFIFRPQKKQ